MLARMLGPEGGGIPHRLESPEGGWTVMWCWALKGGGL